jgi:hypothetical protein
MLLLPSMTSHTVGVTGEAFAMPSGQLGAVAGGRAAGLDPAVFWVGLPKASLPA